MLIKFTFVKHRVNKNRCHFKIQKLYYTCNWDFLPLSPALAALLLFCWLLTIFLLGLAFGLSEGGKFAKLVTFRAREDLKISEFYKICQCLRFIGIPKSLIICQHYKVRNSKVNNGNLVEITRYVYFSKVRRLKIAPIAHKLKFRSVEFVSQCAIAT